MNFVFAWLSLCLAAAASYWLQRSRPKTFCCRCSAPTPLNALRGNGDKQPLGTSRLCLLELLGWWSLK